MYEAVDTLVYADEQSKVRYVLDFALDGCPKRILLADQIPWIGNDLLHAKGYPSVVRSNVKDDSIDFFAHGNDLGRMSYLSRPRHLGNMDKPLDPLLQFDKGAIVRQADDPSRNARTHRIILSGNRPRVLGQLFHAQGDPLLLKIDVEDLYRYLLAHGEELRRVFNASPRDIRDMQQAVYTAKVDKDPVFGDVLHDPFDNLALVYGGQSGCSLGFPFLLQDDPPGQDDVAPLTIELQDPEGEALADHIIQVPDGMQVSLGTG